MNRGTFVQTWWDTGALGATILYGRVTRSGPKAYTVQWESGFTNTIKQGDTRVTVAHDPAYAAETLERLDAVRSK